MAVRASNLMSTKRTSPRDAAVSVNVGPATLPTLPESSGGLSLYDILTIDDLHCETGLGKEFLCGICRHGELRHFKKGDGGGRGHGILIMRKDFVEWWDKQAKVADQSNELAEVMARSTASALTRFGSRRK